MEVLLKAPEGNFVRYLTDDGAELLRDSGTLLPRKFVACFPGSHPTAPDLHLRFEVRAGVPQCREVFLQAHPDGREVRPVDIKSAIDLELYTEVACQMAALHVTGELAGDGVTAAHSGAQPDLETVAKSVSRARRNTRRQIPDEKLPEIAAVYLASPGRGAKAVEERFGLKERTASLYIKRARDAGLLEEVGKP